MMGQQTRNESLFYYFRLEEQIPEDHLLRLIDHYIDLGFVRDRLKRFYSATGRPSIDPEVLLRLLLVGYLYGITSERRLLESGLSLVHATGLQPGDPRPLYFFEESTRTISPVGCVPRSVRGDRAALSGSRAGGGQESGGGWDHGGS